jgi:hypothetical protein
MAHIVGDEGIKVGDKGIKGSPITLTGEPHKITIKLPYFFLKQESCEVERTYLVVNQKPQKPEEFPKPDKFPIEIDPTKLPKAEFDSTITRIEIETGKLEGSRQSAVFTFSPPDGKCTVRIFFGHP